MNLYNLLQSYHRKNICPMHMPGHKRRALHGPELPWHLDITEIHGFDNLHAPEGILLEAQARAARFWGSDGAYFLVNGSSGGILAGIYACTRSGDKVLIARNCHKSVYHAMELFGLCPVYLEPPVIAEAGVLGSVSPASVAQALAAHPDIRLAVIPSPTYEGVCSDVGGIAEVLHRQDIPLFVDEAHGAHFGLSAAFPPGAIRQGADLVVHSLHKTLPSLTQTAILHRVGERISHAALRHALGVFQTTSPSYLLLASLDSCTAFLEAEGAALFALWQERLDRFYQAMTDLLHLRLLRGNFDHIYTHDPGKITVLTGGTDLTGAALMSALRTDCGIELEMALDSYAVAMTGLTTTDEDLTRMAAALRQLDGTCRPAPGYRSVPIPPIPAQALPAGAALNLPGRQIPFAESVGAISLTYLWAYPPGVPLVTPGAWITEEVADCLAQLVARGVTLQSTFASPPGMIEVIDKPSTFR